MADHYYKSVFINCPFDAAYEPILRAMCFSIVLCGCIPRCALDRNDGADIRILAISRIIGECGWCIHDVSRVPTAPGELPRMNMPLELGIHLGARHFGDDQQSRKKALIMDSEYHRYDVTLSDISGQDPVIHQNDPQRAAVLVRDWLSDNRGRRQHPLPGGAAIWEDYCIFQSEIGRIARTYRLDTTQLTHSDFIRLIQEWLKSLPAGNILQ